MKLSFWLNGVYRHDDVEPDTLLLDFLRDKGCYSVKRGCRRQRTVIMHCTDGRKACTFLQHACAESRRQKNCDHGGNAKRGRGVRRFPCR